jgi:nucleotide-binding universal stress UspA family protein
MFSTIVVGHDGSAAADAALRLAQQLVAADGRLLVAHALVHRRRHRHDAAAPDLAALAAAAGGPAQAEPRVVHGHSVEQALASLAGEEGADLIVVGSDRHHGDYRGHLVLGLRLLRHAPCAVAIGPAPGEDGEIRRIGVAYDGSPEAELALDAAYELARRLQAAITLYLAVTPETYASLSDQFRHRDAGALLDAAAARAPEGVNPATVTVSGWASRAIAESTASLVDLLVLGSRRHGALQRALDGSTSWALTVELDRAVLIAQRATAAG